MPLPKLCLRPNCGRYSRIRGLCHKHYRALNLKVSKGETSFEIEVAQGRCEEKQQRGLPLKRLK